MTPSTQEAALVAAEMASLNAGERLRFLQREFAGRVVASTSFGIQSAVMLDLIAEHAPEIPVIFVDTGYLFPETYQYAERLVERFGTDLRVYQPTMTSARMEAVHGRLWEAGGEAIEKYGVITKIEPMDRALRELGADVWLSGVRRSQSSTRADRSFAEHQKRILKVYPILDWSDTRVLSYMQDRGLPPHPLAEQGYVTMGDWHSTRPALEGLDPEATRFGGQKYECGLHLESGRADFQI
jgi:phosphoadenosine phosphosulfate reductase